MPVLSINVNAAKPAAFGNLKIKVARVVGGQREPATLGLAGELINEIITELNTKLYECNKFLNARITSASGTATYALATNFYKELEAHEMSASTGGDKVRQLGYIDYAIVQHAYDLLPTTGRPTQYTLFNQHNTGNVTFIPTPDGIYFYDINYFRRFALLEGDDDVFDAPQEVERVLVLKAQGEILRVLAPSNPMTQTTLAMGEKAWLAFLGVEARHPDKAPHFRLAPIGRSLRSLDQYIRIR